MAILRSQRLPVDSPKTQRSTVHLTSDGKTIVHSANDVEGILRANKFRQGTQTMRHKHEILNHVAQIDVIVLKKWCQQRGIRRGWWRELFANDGKLLREFLNDPDNRAWRTRLGRV